MRNIAAVFLNAVNIENERGKFTEVRMDSEEGGADPLILQRRAEIKDVYTRVYQNVKKLKTGTFGKISL